MKEVWYLNGSERRRAFVIIVIEYSYKRKHLFARVFYYFRFKGEKMFKKSLGDASRVKNTTCALVLGSTLLFAGCGTLSLETNVKMTKSVFLRPVPVDKKSVYVSLKNISEENLEIMDLLQTHLKTKGYALNDNPETAEFVLMVNILFANNLKEAHAISAAAGMGVTGGVVAAGSGSNTGDSLLIGAGMALAAGLVGKALEDETYRAIVDVSVNQRLPLGEDYDATEKTGTMGRGYKEHRTRVIAEAVQTNLKLEEALPILSADVARQITNIF